MPRPRRSDARRNREAIIRAADESITRVRQLPSAQQLARLTGLGLATIYRHFPDRRGLVLAVTEEHFAVLREAVRKRADDPTAFAVLLRGVMLYQASMRALVDELRQIPEADVRGNLHKLLDALREPFVRCQAAGYLDSNVKFEDVPIVLSMLQAVVDVDAEQANRAIPLLLRGLFRHMPGEWDLLPPQCARNPIPEGTAPADTPPI